MGDKKEYIERGALLNILNAIYEECRLNDDGATSDLAFDVIRHIEDQPAADVVEVRHGYWILWKPRRENRNATYKCSVCGKLRSSYYNDVGEWEYCPCGARMDGERKEQT